MLDLYTLTTTDIHETVRVSSMAFAMQVYARALLAFREVVEAVRADRDPYQNRLGFIRVVQDLIDVATSRPELLVSIMELQKARAAQLACSYSETHAANACVYAVLLGLMLRLDRPALLDLGTSALLADVGSALLGDDDIAAKKTVLSPAEKDRRGALLTRALQTLLGREGNDDSIMLRTIVAYEHRRPLAGDEKPLHLYSRVVAVASAYDAMTTDRP